MSQRLIKFMPWIILFGLLSACTVAAPTPRATSTPPVPTPTPQSRVIGPDTVDRLQPEITFDLPGSFITVVSFSPDSRFLLTSDMNGEVVQYDRSGWQKAVLVPAIDDTRYGDEKGTYFAGTMALSPDGSFIIFAKGELGQVAGIDRTGQELFSFPYGAVVFSLAISPGGRYVAVAGEGNQVLVYDLVSRTQVASLVSDHEYISHVVFSPDDSLLAVSYERPGNVIKTWDVATWQEKETLTQVTTRIDYHDIIFTPDGAGLVIASTDPVEIVFVDLTSKEIFRQFPGHSRAPYQVAFSADARLFASACDDMTLDLWDLSSGESVRLIRTGGETGTVAFSPDGTLMAFSVWGKGIEVWSVSP